MSMIMMMRMTMLQIIFPLVCRYISKVLGAIPMLAVSALMIHSPWRYILFIVKLWQQLILLSLIHERSIFFQTSDIVLISKLLNLIILPIFYSAALDLSQLSIWSIWFKSISRQTFINKLYSIDRLKLHLLFLLSKPDSRFRSISLINGLISISSGNWIFWWCDIGKLWS